MKYKLFQINITNEESDVINSMPDAWQHPKFKAHCDAMFGNPSAGLSNDFYEHVADIEANNLDDVFEVGNIGPEERITRFKPMHSVSVGDIVENELGERFVVAKFGFELVEKYYIAA